jgi:hypothetical protein
MEFAIDNALNGLKTLALTKTFGNIDNWDKYEIGHTDGKKYYRIYLQLNDTQKTAKFFICKQTGIVYKAASWDKASKTQYGNIEQYIEQPAIVEEKPAWTDTWGFDSALVYPEGVETVLDAETGFYAIVEGAASEIVCEVAIAQVQINYVDTVGNPIKIEGDRAVVYSRKHGNKLKEMALSQFEMNKKWLQTEEQWQAANAVKAKGDRKPSIKKERQPKSVQDWNQFDDEIAQQISALASNRCDRARLILQLTQKYSDRVISEKINLSVSKIQRESRAREIYDSSAVIQDLFAQKCNKQDLI